MDEKLDRIIELLEQINRKLSHENKNDDDSIMDMKATDFIEKYGGIPNVIVKQIGAKSYRSWTVRDLYKRADSFTQVSSGRQEDIQKRIEEIIDQENA